MFNEIFQKAKTEIVMPFVRRFASNLATGASIFGLTADQITTLEAALVILGGVVIDLVLTKKNRDHVIASWGRS